MHCGIHITVDLQVVFEQIKKDLRKSNGIAITNFTGATVRRLQAKKYFINEHITNLYLLFLGKILRHMYKHVSDVIPLI